MIDTMVAVWLVVCSALIITAGLIVVWIIVLLSIIIEDIIRCLWFGGNGEEGSDWRQRRRKYKNTLRKMKNDKK